MSETGGNDFFFSVPSEFHQLLPARTLPPTKVKSCKNVRGLPLHQRKLFRNMARQTPRVQGLTFDHNQIRWISYWKNEQNKQVQKHFPVSRFGFFGARKLALEERNRIQGWPLDTDEAASAIEKLKVDAAAFEGREDSSNPNAEDSQPLDIDEEAPNTQVAESALSRSMREEGDDAYDRQRGTASGPRRRATRRNVKRSLHASTQTDRRDRAHSLETDRLNTIHPNSRQERIDLRTLREASDYSEALTRAVALAAAQQAEQTPLEYQRNMQRQVSEAMEPWTRRFKPDDLAEALFAIPPGRAPGSLFLDGGPDRHSTGSSRLVSMASSFEETEPLGDSSMTDDNLLQEPDPLRDLLNCVVSQPVDRGIDWEAEMANSSINIDVATRANDFDVRNLTDLVFF
ncbi:hypothetical protein Efla_001096 [Eimeria flavescens]